MFPNFIFFVDFYTVKQLFDIKTANDSVPIGTKKAENLI